MKHSIGVKFLVILLTAFSLVAAFAGATGIISLESAGLYINSLDELHNHEYESIARTIANNYANLYAAETLGDVPYLLKQNLYPDPANRSDTNYWYVSLRQDGVTISEFGASNALDHCAAVEEFIISPLYPIVSSKSPDEEEIPEATETEPLPTDAQDSRSTNLRATSVPEDYLYYEQETMWSGGKLVTYYLYYYQAPEYVVNVFLQEKVLENSSLHILTSMYPYRYTCIAVLIIGLILFAAGMVFLFWVAGKNHVGEIQPGGLNRIPLDVYALIVAVGIFLLIQLFNYLSKWTDNEGPHPGNLSLLIVNLMAITLLGIGFLYALAAQIKVKGAYWWHHSALGWCCAQIGRGIRFLWKCIGTLLQLMPVIWQWLLYAGLMILGGILLLIPAFSGNSLFIILLIVYSAVCVCIVIYSGACFGLLMRAAKRMNEGNLTYKIPTEYLFGSFRSLANELNTLSDTAMQTAEKELRSERMKSELITNVSHDIKTPLTSIINFVDLLQKPHTEQQQTEYLEVLSRQSSRMKKLIEDLMELSKASTGNITVHISTMDAAETVNQALGEFSDKLEAARLTPVFHQPEEPIMMRSDGRLVWRVLSNLLSNAVKYAVPDTRLYIDLSRFEDKVLLSIKNISKEELNVHADELMERFVRGDTSRKSEGSGLGLNIAKSLMEVQNGQMQLLLDGDLFKVTLIFPAE